MIIKLRSVTQVINWAYRIGKHWRLFSFADLRVYYFLSNGKFGGWEMSVPLRSHLNCSENDRLLKNSQHHNTTMYRVWCESDRVIFFCFPHCCRTQLWVLDYVHTHAHAHGTVPFSDFNLRLINDRLALTFCERKSLTFTHHLLRLSGIHQHFQSFQYESINERNDFSCDCLFTNVSIPG